MNITRASYQFADTDQNPAVTLFIPFDGYPSGAATYLRAMLLDAGVSEGEAFQRANRNASTDDPSGGLGTSYRYKLDGMELVAEQRVSAGVNSWNPIYSGPLLDFIHAHATEPMLHAIGTRADGGVNYSTLEQLEMYLAEAQSEAIRYEAGVFAVAGETAAERVQGLRSQLLGALRTELLAGRAESGNYEPQLKTFTVIAEIWANEQGYTATVRAVDDEAAAGVVQEQYRQLVAAEAKARQEEETEDEDSERGLLRIWAVVEGEPSVVMLRDAD